MVLIVLMVVLSCLALHEPVMGLSVSSTQLSATSSPSLRDLDSREAKFLSTFITIRNVACDTEAGTACLTKDDCTAQGGEASGLCLLGLGVCCEVAVTTEATTITTAAPIDNTVCGGKASGRTSRFINPGYPSSYSTQGTCKLSVQLVSDNVCQLKIEFTKFELDQPDVDGNCNTDYFKVTGSANEKNIPLLCGDNSGRHVYVDVDPTMSSPTINMFLDNNAGDRSWDLNIVQVDCDSPSRAPVGCLQYHTEQSGTIESFNYKRGLSTLSNANTHLANMDYGVCIASLGYCKVSYSRTSDSKYAFLLSNNPDTNAGGSFDDADDDFLLNLVSQCGDCLTDYVVIPQATYTIGTATTSNDRFCGVTFPPKVTSTAAPFVFYVKTDGAERANDDTFNNGFSLEYVLSEEC